MEDKKIKDLIDLVQAKRPELLLNRELLLKDISDILEDNSNAKKTILNQLIRESKKEEKE